MVLYISDDKTETHDRGSLFCLSVTAHFHRTYWTKKVENRTCSLNNRISILRLNFGKFVKKGMF